MAEIGLCSRFRTPRSAEEAAALAACRPTGLRNSCGAALAGVCFINKIDGVDNFLDHLGSGIMEMMTNNKENVRSIPDRRILEAYGRVRGPKTAGLFPVGVGSCGSFR